MKMCLSHWAALKALVVGKGMGTLIAADAEMAHRQMVEEVEAAVAGAEFHQDNLSTYDPLVASYWTLMWMAIKSGGLYLMEKKPGDGEGEYCPLCEVEAAGVRVEGKAGLATEWMEGCTDSVLVYCRDNGLLAKPQ